MNRTLTNPLELLREIKDGDNIASKITNDFTNLDFVMKIQEKYFDNKWYKFKQDDEKNPVIETLTHWNIHICEYAKTKVDVKNPQISLEAEKKYDEKEPEALLNLIKNNAAGCEESYAGTMANCLELLQQTKLIKEFNQNLETKDCINLY